MTTNTTYHKKQMTKPINTLCVLCALCGLFHFTKKIFTTEDTESSEKKLWGSCPNKNNAVLAIPTLKQEVQ
jgi:hypothetical protein